MKDRCPPHRFVAAWDSPPPTIYCKWCGDIRELIVPNTEPQPGERVLTAAEAEQMRRDYGEPS